MHYIMQLWHLSRLLKNYVNLTDKKLKVLCFLESCSLYLI